MGMLNLLHRKCISSGIECYVVGGALRDRLLGRAVNEVDLLITAQPEQMAEYIIDQHTSHAFWLDRERGMLRVTGQEGTVDLSPLLGSLEKDLEQRDFTINAMAQRLNDYLDGNEEIIDPFGGRDALIERSLRPVHSGSMLADPLRVMRGIRLLITRGLQLDEASAVNLREAAHLIESVPAERISQELAKILTAANAPTGVDYLHRLGVVAQILPEVSAMQGVVQNNYHQYTVDDHADKAFAAFVDIIHRHAFLTERAQAWTADYWSSLSQEARYAFMLAAWLHDIGKPLTRAVRNGKVTFYGHEHVGAGMVREIAARLKLSREQSTLLSAFVEYHMYPMQLWRTGRLDGRLLHRYYHRAGAVGVPIVLFTLADHLAKGEVVAASDTFREHARVVERFLAAWFEHRAEIVAPQPLLTGDEIAAAVGRQPGPWLRQVKELLLEAQAGSQVTDKAQAKELARRVAQEVERGSRDR